MIQSDAKSELIERFFRYAAIESQSDAAEVPLPSSTGQLKLARLLAEELLALGVEDVVVDDQAIVTGVKRGKTAAPRVGFIAHLDTVDVGLSPTVHPQILRYEGQDLCLNAEHDIWLRTDEHPELIRWKGEDIIVGDGTSVLGADNKAAIAVIMTLLARSSGEEDHGDIVVAFVPDEEIGLRGSRVLDLERFPCDFAYTIDCCELGEVMIENFNAASGKITFRGVSAHPMSARGVMVNPLMMAMDFIDQFDRNDTPECTDGRDGFFWCKDLVTDESEGRLSILIRDFDRERFDDRKRRILDAAETIRLKYPTGEVRVDLVDTYQNMNHALQQDPRAERLLFQALEDLEIARKLVPMRGGTDGAILSAKGIPTPNFFTGAYKFHSRYEFLPVPAFEKSYLVAAEICRLVAMGGGLLKHRPRPIG
ncbi:UNVERIFIED_ORG: tripeptide aminopeptidase [Agrobacterium larrymoorei]|uniref:Peptidase T n=2 Tax=Rhizobium/Agrobacterium group TaxID=227290 RepID=A0AA92BZB4_RHIRH|nr:MULTISPECIES: peptidase T [Rhizobium/Agrobacterium group]MDP9573813.1 tripeptide aminopeptidase [Agrobacterium larrymoorei]PVE62662.1 peptidase T [Agrobacterium tumefaciens]PVE70800.1 peptidase T [Sphingomonas sp. TPD3009]PVE50208.1 peptidase T [Rhizobium rhizogenes]TBN14804.1 peptidase T [Agrobacterium cavarae]